MPLGVNHSFKTSSVTNFPKGSCGIYDPLNALGNRQENDKNQARGFLSALTNEKPTS